MKIPLWYVCVCLCVIVFVVLVVVAGLVVCGSYITMETVALLCREDTDAGVSTGLATERSNMATTKCEQAAAGQTSGLFEASFSVFHVYTATWFWPRPTKPQDLCSHPDYLICAVNGSTVSDRAA